MFSTPTPVKERKPWTETTGVEANYGRILWDLKSQEFSTFDTYWKTRRAPAFPGDAFTKLPKVFVDVGAGTGGFFSEMAARHPDTHFIAVERCRSRGTRLAQKTKRIALNNFTGLRGNAVPALIHGIPEQSVDRVYLLYPCPWPKSVQRKNRWYLHPAMRHLIKVLKPGGLLIWASDQEFYIREAEFVCRREYQLEILKVGALEANAWNDLEHFPTGRSKFEAGFLGRGQICYELIARKN